MNLLCMLVFAVFLGLDALSKIAWFNVSLGEPVGGVLLTYGETGYISRDKDGSLAAIAYNIEHGHGALYVGFRNGRVSTIGVRRSLWDGSAPSVADPHGVTLAMTPAQLVALRGKSDSTSDAGWHGVFYNDEQGVKWAYRFLNGQMRAMDVEAPDALMDSLPAAPVATFHGGTSFQDALLNGAADETSGGRNEDDYLLSIHCFGGHSTWREITQALIKRENKEYDLLRLSCYTGEETRFLFIDVTPFFGKP